jgi:peptide/nickel transport system ATP-binding protein
MEWMLHEDASPAEAPAPHRNLFKRVTFDVSALPQSAADSLAPVPNAGPVLSVSNLVTSFLREGEWNAVVRGVSFDVGPRETVAIVGESGSGKSVTALSIMRLIPPQSGRVEGSIKLAGRELTTLPEKAMHHVRGNEVAMIFQEPMTSLNPVLTIGFQIAEALIYHRGMSRQEAEAETVRLLEKVRIPAAKSRFHEYPHRFSGGMRQRVMIAMALACRPKLLIADEPTTALDVTIQAQILELIKVLQEEEDMSVLFITHDMGVVAEIADRTVVMYQGKAVEAGETGQIFAAPAHPYTKALLSAVPQLGSMTGISRPMRFPIVDKATGESDVPVETPDTVKAAERPVLEVSGLTTRFDIHSGLFGKVSGRVHAVENVSFSLHSGETLALVGESGCGKSTTGRSILRLIEPNAGSVLVDGEDVLAMDGGKLRDMRKRMQIIFQDPLRQSQPAHVDRLRHRRALLCPRPRHGRRGARPGGRPAHPRRPVARHGLALSARVLGRPAPAHLHRPRPRPRPEADRRRRGGLGARRVGEGAGGQPDARPAGEHGPRLPLHLP